MDKFTLLQNKSGILKKQINKISKQIHIWMNPNHFISIILSYKDILHYLYLY